MSGSLTGEKAVRRPPKSGLIKARVILLNSALLDVRDRPDEKLDAADGRFVVS